METPHVAAPFISQCMQWQRVPSVMVTRHSVTIFKTYPLIALNEKRRDATGNIRLMGAENQGTTLPSIGERHSGAKSATGLATSLMKILRNRKQAINATVDDETISLTVELLSAEDYADVPSQLNDVHDAEDLIGFIIHSLDSGSLENNPETLRYRARHLVVGLGTTLNAIPSALFLKPEHLSIADTFSVDYGDFSNVYVGNYRGTQVALKRIRQHQMDNKFCRDALAWRCLSHKYILPFIGIYTNPRQSFTSLASPFMVNGTLSEWRKKCNPTAPEIGKYILDIAEGLQYLHCQGLVHGDLRGGHVLLDHDYHVKIANFSLLLHSDVTATRNTILSFQFAAPELFTDEDSIEDGEETQRQTRWTDVYAFGCLYYELHFDVLPFSRNNIYVIGKKVKMGIRPARLVVPALEDRAWDLIERCWSQDPVRRPGMDEVVETMRQWQ